MTNPLEIKDLAGFSGPATELIKRISDAIGGIARPKQIARVSKAEDEAAIRRAEANAVIAKIEAQTGIEITDMQARAVARRLHEDEKDQRNIEGVTHKAIPFLNADAKPEELDEDFVRYLFEKARIVSNDDMQLVWGKILAGEANKPGSFSRRTLEIVSQFSRDDAELFTRLCGNVWGERSRFPMIFLDDKIYASNMDFDTLSHLDAIGLVNFDSNGGLALVNFQKRDTISYFGCVIQLEFLNEDPMKNSLSVGDAFLTRIGQELFSIAGASPAIEYFEKTLEKLINSGIAISFSIHARASYEALRRAGL